MQIQGTGLSKEFKPYELCCDLGYNITDMQTLDMRTLSLSLKKMELKTMLIVIL